jgi:exosortase/archaeosortase family protein
MSRRANTRPQFLIAAQLVAFWPVWRWYAVRVFDSTDQSWGLLALATALFVVFARRVSTQASEHSLALPTFLMLLYAVTYPSFPPLARAGLAFTAIGVTLSLLHFGKPFHAGVLGLLCLSLPLIPSLQFFGGYPLRVLVATLTAPILRVAGFAVVQQGTCLNWSGQLIWIDAPCSGIRMLWVGLYLAFTLICIYELPWVKSLALLTVALFVIFTGNIFRALALFYIESGLLQAPPWAHDYAGLVAFAMVVGGIVAAVYFIRDNKCVEPLSI